MLQKLCWSISFSSMHSSHTLCTTHRLGTCRKDHRMVYDNFRTLSSSLVSILVGMNWYDSQISCNFHIRFVGEVVAFIVLNHLVLCAFKVKGDPFLHFIVLVNPFLSFSFQHPCCFFLLGGFHVTQVIFRHQHFASVAIFVTTHKQLSRFVSVHCVGTQTATIVRLTGWIALGRYFSVELEASVVLEMTIACWTILPVFRLILVTFLAQITRLIANMLFFVIITFLAFLAEITSIQETWHRSNYVIMIIVVIQVDILLGLWTLVHDGIQGLFGNNMDLIPR